MDAFRHAPAFDCLGPGSYCCPRDKLNTCHCEVTTTMAEMKVSRFINTGQNETIQHSLLRRSLVTKQIEDLVSGISRAKTRLFGPRHLNYSWIMEQYPNPRRVVYQMPNNSYRGNKKDP